MRTTCTIRIPRHVYEALKQTAAAEGYASVDEMARHVLEKAARKALDAAAERCAAERARGLGYMA